MFPVQGRCFGAYVFGSWTCISDTRCTCSDLTSDDEPRAANGTASIDSTCITLYIHPYVWLQRLYLHGWLATYTKACYVHVHDWCAYINPLTLQSFLCSTCARFPVVEMPVHDSCPYYCLSFYAQA